MSSPVDARIRREMDRLTRPVDEAGVFEYVARRKARRRSVHRAQVAALAVAVVAGTAAGAYGLSRLFAPAGEAVPGGTPFESVTVTPAPSVSPSAEPTSAPSPTATAPSPTPTIDPQAILCDISSIDADVDGDGSVDDVTVFSPARTCESAEVGQSYWIRLAFGGEGRGELEPQFLEACQPPYSCRLIAAPDLKADGSAELAIQTVPGASVLWFTLYRFDPEGVGGGPGFVRIEVAPPGDPWHEEFGLPPGPALFGLYGSVTHLHGIRCQPESGADWIVVTALRTEKDADLYDVHESQFSLEGAALVLTATADYPDTPVDQLDVVVPTADLCGAPFTFGGP